MFLQIHNSQGLNFNRAAITGALSEFRYRRKGETIGVFVLTRSDVRPYSPKAD